MRFTHQKFRLTEILEIGHVIEQYELNLGLASNHKEYGFYHWHNFKGQFGETVAIFRIKHLKPQKP